MKGLKPEDIKVILATDCGSTTTKAILIEYHDGEYRLIVRGEAPTTVEAPFEDVTMGVLNAIGEVEELSGRKILDDNDKIMSPAKDKDGKKIGTDIYVSTSSAGGGLQMMVAGVVRSMTAESAERAALGAGAIVMDVIASNDKRLPHQQIERIRHLRPDMILLLIARNSKLAPAFLLKAFYLQLAKDVQGSMANYRKVLELDPENPYAANNLAWLLCENNMNLQEALSLARTARKKAPDDPEIADTLGWIYYKLKNHTLAVDQLLFSVNNRKQPTAENYYHLGMAYYGQGNISRAKESLKRALELNQSFPGAQDARKILTLPG